MHLSSRAVTRIAAAFVAIVLFASPAEAQEQRLRGLFRLGAEIGGEKVLQFTYDDGSTPDVPAGAGLLISGGGVLELYRRGAHTLETQLSVGFKWRTIPPATNQDANWIRFPVEALAFYRAPANFRLGGGVTMHLANSLKASGAVLNDEVTFKSNPGFIVQAEWLRRNIGIDVRYTALEYEVDRGGSGTVGASSVGAGFSYFVGGSRQ
jgi:hypothetical protein